jgi:hypothetical protein
VDGGDHDEEGEEGWGPSIERPRPVRMSMIENKIPWNFFKKMNRGLSEFVRS